MIELTKEFIHSLPKAELHCHLDGSMRIDTIIDLAKQQNIELPKDNLQDLTKYLAVGMECQSLEEYLQPFAVTCPVLQTKEALISRTD